MDKQWKTGYKVASKFNGEYYSVTSGGHAVKYTVGEDTHRPKKQGPLCVFSTLEYAELAFDSSYAILSVRYLPSSDMQIWDREDALRVNMFSLPNGTRLADTVHVTGVAVEAEQLD